ncbi:hypothetical protein CLV62_10151 [Dysgonomonas alginatilytica]|uniref:PH (Pleckstrin Homology) domain-containing protein n=1 Tax=Dysgonomonas alginatilytica TaxID=1605892 RepID=A0A2V3PW11_9BACT|nr:hypothetical protein [Dysgonomonas alginatilytica]PXV68788.1 hypothetical protein CLV62_10151 [Dysgonomonas alginatilytica]
MNTKILFSETQKFRQWWLWILLLAVFFKCNSLFLYGIFKQIVKGEQFGNNPMSDTGLLSVSIVTFIITSLIICLFAYLRLDTKITEDGIYVKFFPFNLTYKKHEWEQISKSFVRQYNPISEYGGWGLRLGALNVSGNKGLQLVFKNGKKLLIGTNKVAELNELLTKIGKVN